MRFILSITLFLWLNSLLSQFLESFDDGDFTANPPWVGDTALFIINPMNELQLWDTGFSGIAYLSTISQSIFDADWKFRVRFEFNPSSSNYCKIYISSDRSDLTNSLYGYYIQVGGTNDNISLYRQTGSAAERIIEGRKGILNQSINDITIQLKRKKDGRWILKSDTSQGSQFVEEGMAKDVVYFNSNYFGIVCKYTKTRNKKIYIDDIEVYGQESVPDTVPVKVKSIQIIDSVTILIQYDKDLDETSALSLSNYSISNDFLPVKTKLRDNSKVDLTFNRSLKSGQSCTINIRSVMDTAGNTIKDTSLVFTYFRLIDAKRNSIIISEFLADPSPPVALPECEYIELYNRSNEYADLTNWTISDPHSTGIINTTLAPHEYLLICTLDQCKLFVNATKCVEISPFPSLNNSADHIYLKDNKGETIFELSYSSSWLNDEKVKKGGTSLEVVNHEINCYGQFNYKASRHPSGGTPGFQNSQLIEVRNNSQIEFVEYLETNMIQMKLNQPIDTFQTEVIELYCPDIDQNLNKQIVSEFTLNFIPQHKLKENVKYNCSVNLPYCYEYGIHEEQFSFIVPHQVIARKDIIINEMYFNPPPGGSDFIELFNSSEKFISLKQLHISNEKDTTYLFQNDCKSIIHPLEFVIITEDSSFLKDRFLLNGNEHMVQVKKLVSMPDDSGIIILNNLSNNLIDVATYNESYHNDFLLSKEDVSLERIHHEIPGTAKNNWSSASELYNFGTPGRENSQRKTVLDEIKIIPDIISPNGDGVDDILTIHYAFSKPGNLCNSAVFDLRGICHMVLDQNVVMPSRYINHWDGFNKSGKPVATGAYFIFLECYSQSGLKSTHKLPFYVQR